MVSKTMKKMNMTTQAGFDYGGIPPGIQKRGLFCLYRLELKTANAVKPDKVPYKQNGTRADPSKPSDFCSFEEALAAYNSGGFDGMGIGCFGKVGMADLDGCVHDGKLDEWAKEIVDELDSYTELSPSGTGIHIFFLVDDFTYDKERYYMRISEFCGLTIKDIDLEHRIVNIDHQLQRLSDMTLVIEPTKTSAGTRKLPITENVAKCFQAILEDREKPKVEKVVDGYTGFLFLDDKGLPLVAMHWEHRFNHMVKRYNDIYRVQMPNITPHICRHTYCSNMAKSGMNPKTLQYLMGHSDIGVTLNTYTHLGLEDAEDELKRLEDLQNARKELERTQGEKPVSQKMFKAI